MAQACWEELGVGRRVKRESAVLKRHSMLTLIDRFTGICISGGRRSKTLPLVPDRKVHEIRVSPRPVPCYSDPKFKSQVRHP